MYIPSLKTTTFVTVSLAVVSAVCYYVWNNRLQALSTADEDLIKNVISEESNEK